MRRSHVTLGLCLLALAGTEWGQPLCQNMAAWWWSAGEVRPHLGSVICCRIGFPGTSYSWQSFTGAPVSLPGSMRSPTHWGRRQGCAGSLCWAWLLQTSSAECGKEWGPEGTFTRPDLTALWSLLPTWGVSSAFKRAACYWSHDHTLLLLQCTVQQSALFPAVPEVLENYEIILLSAKAMLILQKDAAENVEA